MESLRVAVVGSGYVGTTLSACLADFGHDVIAVDVDEDVVDALSRGEAPIDEPGLAELLARHAGEGLRATTDHGTVATADVTFIAVGTPSTDDGSLDRRALLAATGDVGEALADGDGEHVVAIKSTVLPDVVEEEVRPRLRAASGRSAADGVHLAVNPEFLREGSAVADLLDPDRIVIGARDDAAVDRLTSVYAPLVDTATVFETGIREAAMIKYANNAFLATKLSYINDVGNLCKLYDVDTYEVADALGLDDRIGARYLRSGVGWGGSCLPKDTAALRRAAVDRGYAPRMLEAAIEVNEGLPGRLLELLARHVDVEGRRVAVLGLAFKPGTDDVRHSRAIPVIRGLQSMDADVAAYDPNARARAAMVDRLPAITVVDEVGAALRGAVGACVVTGWPEFADLDDAFDAMETPVVVDGRRVVRRREGLVYEGLHW